MARVQEGDAQAFEVIFDRHADAAFSLAYRMCGRRITAEDVVQEAFLSLWRTGARYDRTRGSVRSWVLGVVHNRAIDLFRRDAVRTSRDVFDEGGGGADSRRRQHRGRGAPPRGCRRGTRALRELPADQRQVIELAYFGGFSHSEIAEQLKLPAGTVKGRMRLGLTKLRLSLGEPVGSAAMTEMTR